MPVRVGRAFFLFVLLVVAVVSWQWLDDTSVTSLPDNESVDMAESQSDYYLEDFEIINVQNAENNADTDLINDSGNAARRVTITGKSLSHHYINGNSILDNPTVVLRTESDEYWQASASSGNVSAEFDVLDLQGAVELSHHKPGADKLISNSTTDASITVDTESLTIDTSQGIIQTDDAVAVNGQGWEYTANSMRAEVDNGTLSFQSGVEATFANPD